MGKNVVFSRRTISSYVLVLLPLVFLGLCGCEKEESESTSVFRPGYLDVKSGLRITSCSVFGNVTYNIFYTERGDIDYISTAGYNFDGKYVLNDKGDKLSLIPDERLLPDGLDIIEETWTLKFNNQGYLSNAYGIFDFVEDDEHGVIRFESSFLYDNNSHLTRMSIVDYEGTVIESTSITLSWDNNLLKMVEISESYGGNGETSTHLEKYKYYYEKTDNVNTYRQLAPCSEYLIETYMLGLFSNLGLLGDGPVMLPSRVENIDNERIYNYETHYLFNDYGALIYWDDNTFSYEFDK